MTAAEIKAIIEMHGGVDSLLGFGFDNSASSTFTPHQFSYSSNLDEVNNLLKFTAYDSGGIPYIIVKPTDTVQTIMFKDPSVANIDIYDRVTLRS